jgi:hypothetical protein
MFDSKYKYVVIKQNKWMLVQGGNYKKNSLIYLTCPLVTGFCQKSDIEPFYDLMCTQFTSSITG